MIPVEVEEQSTRRLLFQKQQNKENMRVELETIDEVQETVRIKEEVFHSLILGSYYVVELRSKNFSKFLITPITYNSLKNLRHTPFANGEVKSSDDFNRTIILITLLRRGNQVKR